MGKIELQSKVKINGTILLKDKFTCSNCKNEYPFFMKGGTNKMVAETTKYSDDHEIECCYCKGFYPDGTICKGGNK